MSETITLDDLRAVLIEAAGATEEIQASDEYGDELFIDLGYDSLALMESAAQLKRRFGVVIPEEELESLTTPRAMLAYANGPGRPA